MAAIWAAEIPKDSLHELLQLRLAPGIECAEAADCYWLRGNCPIDEARDLLRSIPHLKLYSIEVAGLKLWGNLLVSRPMPTFQPGIAAEKPSGHLLNHFAPLAQVTPLTFPVAAYPSATISKIPLRLLRSAHSRSAAFQVITREQLAELASTAPQVRLDRWTFAIAGDGRVLVHGQPLPAIPGKQYWELDGNLIPLGWDCGPSIDGPILSRILGREENQYGLLHEDGTQEVILQTAFVPASRAAIRTSLEGRAP